MTFWVVQHDLFHENQRQYLIETLERLDILHQIVSVNSDWTLDPEVTYEGPIITNGSILLSKIANQRGWSPGGLYNENFSYSVWMPHFKEHLLNKDAVLTTFMDARPPARFFVRPVNDEKSFTGQVMTLEAFDDMAIDPQTPILYASEKAVGQEHRHFVVDGAIISSSRYKLNGEPNLNAFVDQRVIDFAQSMVDIWQPAKAFVLDTYSSGDEIGIVEMGGICHAGFYKADIQKIVMALNELEGDSDGLSSG